MTQDEVDSFTLATWESAAADADALSVLLVELDDFERYCDNYGAEAGEVLLQRISAVIRASGLTVRSRAERILRGARALEVPNRGSTVSNYVTVSIGAASCRPQPGDCMVTLIDAGASALWTAKGRGRDRIAAYELSPPPTAEEAVSGIRYVG